MDKKFFRSLILLMTYAVFLVLLVLRFDSISRFLSAALEVCKPLFLGFAIAFILHRPCNFFLRTYRKGLPEPACRPLAVASSYIAMFAVIFGIVSFVVPQVLGSVELFVSNLNGYVARLQAAVNHLIAALGSDYLNTLDLSGLSDILQKMGTAALDAVSNALPRLFTLTGTLLSALVTALLSTVFSVYMLSGGERLKKQFRALVQAYLPPKFCERLLFVTALTADTFTRFISGQALEACILGGLCCIGMLLLRLPYAPLISLIIGVSALIPVAGAYLGALFSALILVMISPMQAVVFLLFLLILQQIEGNVIYPRVVGSSLGLPGLWVLAAVTVGGGLFGFPGMLLGVPVAAVCYTLVQEDVRRRLKKK